MIVKSCKIALLLLAIYVNDVNSLLQPRLTYIKSNPKVTSLKCVQLDSSNEKKSCKTIMDGCSINEGSALETPEDEAKSLAQNTSPNFIAESGFFVSSICLLKNCVGAGVFSIHSRVGNLPMPAVSALIYFMASWATYNFYLIGETCRLTNTSTYSEAWSNTVSRKSRWLVQSVVVVAPIVSCLANSIVLADILRLLFQSLGFPASIYDNRSMVIGILSSVVLYPLCIQKSLSGLTSVSFFGIIGHITAMLALGVRLFDKSYSVGGRFYAETVARAAISAKAASLAKVSLSSTMPIAKWSMLASLLSYCFVTHYNAPRYYTELEGKEKSPLRFGSMAFLSYMTAATIYVGTILLTFKTFTNYSPIFALNGFSPKDTLGSVARLAFGTSVLASFPLIFLSMRNWFVAKAARFFPVLGNTQSMTVVLLTFIGLLATKCTDIGLVGSLAGGLLGSSMMFIFPPVMYMRAIYKQAKATGTSMPYTALILNSVLLMAGAALGGFGTLNSVLSAVK